MSRNERAVWNRFAGIYDFVIKKDQSAYDEMIGKIKRRLHPKDRVLEIATGTGAIALGLSGVVDQLDAVDFSETMIQAARKKAQESGVGNIRFDVQDACQMPCPDAVYDVVIVSNALHIMPEPERALLEVRRILRPEGILIAPTFVHAASIKAALLSRLMSLSGFRAYHKWTEQGYHAFLEQNGFAMAESSLLDASFPLAYTVLVKA